MLDSVRVVDLAGDVAPLAAQALADLGADVVRVELADLAQSALPAPWPRDREGASLYRSAYARNTRRTRADRMALAHLLARADVLIEGLDRGAAERLELDAASVATRHPHLVHVSVTPFGTTGPKSRYRATDLIATAASGYLFVSGAPVRAPLRVSAPQAHAHAGADAAVAALIALRAREQSGFGQHVDVAMQESLTLALLAHALDGPLAQPRTMRNSGETLAGAMRVRFLYEARDGFVMVQHGLLPPVAQFQRRLADWLVEEKLIERAYLDWDWGTLVFRMVAGTADAEAWRTFDRAVETLCASRTKLEMMNEAVRRKLLVGPLFDIGDLLDSPQFAARGFVQSIDTEAGRLRVPGPFARLPKCPIAPSRVHGAVDARALIASWPVVAAPVRTDAVPSLAPLAGLKVLDLFWVVAGPGATRMLADFGATVVHVESSTRTDMARSVPPYIGGVVAPEHAGLFHTTNAGKLDLALDLGAEAGKRVLRDLIAWADVFTESFAPGVVERLGFGYDAVRAINPSIVMISSCLLGQSGPWRDYAGFGNLAAAVTGFHALTGRPGEPPSGCYGPYTDFIGVRYNALAILAALAHRERTGEGQHVDMAQAEAAVHFLAPQAVDHLTHGTVPRALGNRDPDMAPHGVYRAFGDDRWVAIAVEDDRQWQALCEAAGLDTLGADAGLRSLAGRKAGEDRIDAALSAWTERHTADDVERLLQSAGVAAHAVLDTSALASEPMLRHRRHFHSVAHPMLGATFVESARIVCSRTPALVPRTVPTYGSDAERVLGGLLGYSRAQIAELDAQGALK